MRVSLESDPFAHLNRGKTLWMRNTWPASWVAHPQANARPIVVAYRRIFQLPAAATIRLHVSADERYQLYLDGELLGRGPERGDPDHWFFETFDVTLPAGLHTLVARVWSLGEGDRVQMGGDSGGGAGGQIAAPYAQLSVYHGLLIASDEAHLKLLATGVAPWEAKILPGYSFSPPGLAWGTGAKIEVDGSSFAWGFKQGEGDGWQPVVARHGGVTLGRMEAGPSHILHAATLPAMISQPVQGGSVRHVDEGATSRIVAKEDLPEERQAMQSKWSSRQPFVFKAATRRRLIIDLENYYCAYPVILCSGGQGAVVRLNWAESLYKTPNPAEKRKGDRSEIKGKYFIGVGDTFRPAGEPSRAFETLWWEAGRYLELRVETADQPLELTLDLHETRYPLEMTAAFDSSDPHRDATLPTLLRGVQMCAHETYIDCPYYEQLMYLGDTRLQALITYAISGDPRLPRKAIALFNASRLPGGLLQSRYPSRVRQVIPPFALWWIAMVHDYALWQNDPEFVRSMMPGVRAVIEAYQAMRSQSGLIEGPSTAWNFVDWVPSWKNGVPPDGDCGASSVINWQFVYTLRLAKALEEWSGEVELAARCDRIAREIAAEIQAQFWEPVRGMFADDRAKRHFSEHAQCLAILSGCLSEEQCAQVGDGLLTSHELVRTTIYFTHYLFEAYRLLAEVSGIGADPQAALFERLSFWFDLHTQGLVTPLEEPEPSRSDCHGWGSHPLFHYLATVLGIRPAAPGFTSVEIRPRLGKLRHLKGKVPHPSGGFIEVELTHQDKEFIATIVLPDRVTGILHLADRTTSLKSGRNDVGAVPT